MEKDPYYKQDTDYNLAVEPCVMLIDSNGIIRYTTNEKLNGDQIGKPLWDYKQIPHALGRAILGFDTSIIIEFSHNGTPINWLLRFSSVKLSPEVAVLLRVNALPEGSEKLTVKEIDYLRLIASGMTNQEMGLELDQSNGTITKRLSGIVEKLGIETRAELLAYAIKFNGYLENGIDFPNPPENGQ